jgi:hypothetical protein
MSMKQNVMGQDRQGRAIERTDGCLYAAKRHGRNRVMCETDPEVTARGTAIRVAYSAIMSSRNAYSAAPLAGVSCTDSPQPQADVWFGLLKTNWADNFSVL